jgi:hypothetical protein
MPDDEPVAIEDSSRMGEFQMTGDYSLMVDGENDPDAQIFQSDLSLQFVILSSELSVPLVLDLRSSQVRGISEETIERKAGGGLNLLDTSGAENLGAFEVGPQGLGFVLDGREIQIKSR